MIVTVVRRIHVRVCLHFSLSSGCLQSPLTLSLWVFPSVLSPSNYLPVFHLCLIASPPGLPGI